MNKVNKKIILAWLFFIAFIPLLVSRGLKQMALYYLIINLLLYAYLFFSKNIQNLKIPESWFWLFLLLFIVWSVISLLWTVNWYYSVSHIIVWLNALLAALVVFNLNKDQKQKLIYFLLISLFLLVALGLTQYFFDISFVKQSSPPAATFKNKNMFAQYIVLLWPLLLLISPQNSIERHLKNITLIFSIFMLVFIASRAAWLALCIQILILATLSIFKYKNYRELFLILGSVLIAIVISFKIGDLKKTQEKITNIFSQQNVVANNERITSWANSLSILKNNLFLGVGAGNWSIHYPLYKNEVIIDDRARNNLIWNYAHNDYIELAVSSGLIGIVLLLLILFYLFKDFIIKQNYFKNGVYLISIFGIGVCAFFSFPLHLSAQTVVIAIILSLITPDKSIKINNYIKIIGTMVLIVLAAATSFFSDQISVIKHHHLAGKQLSRGNYEEMIKHTTRALEIDSYAPRSLELHGIALNQLKRYVEASNLYHKYLRYFPYNVLALENASIVCLHIRNFACAEDAVSKLLIVEPGSFIANSNKGLLLFYNKKGDKDLAMSYYKRALEIDPNNQIAPGIRDIISNYENPSKGLRRQ